MSAEKKALVVGSGGREHAIVSALRRSPSRPRLFAAPGNAGIAKEAQTVDIPAGSPEDIERLVQFALSERIDLTVVGPEVPLVLGIVDRFEEAGLKIFGPHRAAARLEGSKCFTKEFLSRHGIPTAAFEIFDDPSAARDRVASAPLPVVLKADGLAAGKGVIVAREREEALQAVEAILVERRFGAAGDRLIVEECLEGQEISLFAICDGREYVPLETAQDYKPAFDGGKGPNTGGMGSYSPCRPLGDPMVQRILETVVRPTLDGLADEGLQFRGVLYAGIMLTTEGPQVLEFNVRFGDPETQPILQRLRTDLLAVLEAALRPGGLQRTILEWDPRPAVCVVAASRGYPGKIETGFPVAGVEDAELTAPSGDVKVFHAGTRFLETGEVGTSGGRVLGVTALGEDRAEAREKAYRALDCVSFEGLQARRDIAAV